MLFPIWPNGLAQTLVAIKRSPLILSKGLDGFTVLLQTADGAGRVHGACVPGLAVAAGRRSQRRRCAVREGGYRHCRGGTTPKPLLYPVRDFFASGFSGFSSRDLQEDGTFGAILPAAFW